MLGATNEDLLKLLDIDTATLHNWRIRFPEFRQALTDGREAANARVAKALFHRAIGAQVQETHITVIDGRVVQTPFTRNYPPDTAAAFIWLKNREKRYWRDKSPEGEDLTPEQAAAEVRRAIAQAQATSSIADD
jgi:hypothetical protein